MLEGIFDGEIVKPKSFQNGLGCFGRFGSEVYPEQTSSVSQEVGEFGWGNVGADGLVWAEKERADQI